MPQTTPRIGSIVTHEGKKYRFDGVDPDTGQWKLTPVGHGADQTWAGGVARTAAQGATFGFSDELAGAGKFISALAPGGRPIGEAGQAYKEGRDAARENLAQFREDHSKTAFAAEALGGLATGIAVPGLLAARAGSTGVRGALGIKKASDIAKTARASELAGGLGEGGRIAGKMGQAAKLGALEGGIYGVGTGGGQRDATYSSPISALGESAVSRAKSGLFGAAAGGLLAPAMAGLMGGIGKGREFYKGLQVGRFGRGGTGQIRYSRPPLEEIAKGAKPLSDVEIPKTGGRAAVEADDMAAFGLARLEQTKNPEAFKKRALEWVDAQEKLNSPEYQTYLESGDSELYAGMMAIAEDVLKKEADPGAVAGLLADRSGRHRSTAALAAKTTEGLEGGLLKESTGRRLDRWGVQSSTVTRALDEVEPVFGKRAFETPGRAQTIARLEDEAATLAEESYEAAYKIFKPGTRTRAGPGTANPGSTGSVDPRDLFFDPEYMDVIKKMTHAFRQPKSRVAWLLDEASEASAEAAMVRAEKLGHTVKAENLRRRRYTDILGSWHKRGKLEGQYRPPNITSLTRAEGAEAIDVFRRTLKKVKEDLFSRAKGSGDMDLGREINDFIKMFDGVIGKHSPKFAKAREGYARRRSILDAYEGAPLAVKKSRESIRAHVDTLKTEVIDPVTGNITRKHVPVAIGLDEFGNTVMKSELDMFTQGVLDDFVEKMDVSERAAPENIAQLKRQLERLFGGPKPILKADAAEVRRIAQNLDDLAKQAKLSKKLIDLDEPAIRTELEGAVEATAFGYAMAGQYGAGARTGLAAGVYGPGRWENIGGALARRLRQGEGQGLLNVAENVAKTEGAKVRSLTRRTAGARATPGLLGGARADLEGGARYEGYGPDAARRRAVQESRQSRGL